MSYAIVKSIKIDEREKKVWLKSASSNVYPKDYQLWECTSLSTILKEKGLVAVQKEILMQYFNGEFQKTNNNYEKSLVLLNREKYNWSTVGEGREYSDEELKEILFVNYIAYNNREKGNFIIRKETGECYSQYLYISGFYKRGCHLTPFKSEAKSFSLKAEAEFKIQNFSDNYEVVEVVL